MSTPRLPTVFLPHGGGPWPFMDTSVFGSSTMYDGLAAHLKTLGEPLPVAPRAILLISAHWEAPVATVMSSSAPPMLYDYSGFPASTYQVQWPAPGEPEVAALVREHLHRSGFITQADPERGFDHGTFVPLSLAYPKADIPTLQLSLIAGLDPVEHLRLGQALAPLRDQGVFIVGSGMSYHNMGGFFGRVLTMADDSLRFDDWLVATVTNSPSQREQSLAEWEQAPRARLCHPREEHLIPLMVIAGAAGDDAGAVPYRESIMGAHVSAVRFG